MHIFFYIFQAYNGLASPAVIDWFKDRLGLPLSQGILVSRDLTAFSPLCHWHRPHDDVIKWKYFPRYWPFVRGIHRSPVNYPHKGQWRGASMFSSICAWTRGWVNNREAGDLKRHRAHNDVTVMLCKVSMRQPTRGGGSHWILSSWREGMTYRSQQRLLKWRWWIRYHVDPQAVALW